MMATVGVKHYEMFIGGEWVDSDQMFEIVDPATEELVATVARGTVDHADRAVQAARDSFESGVWSGLMPSERSEILLAIADRMSEELGELSELESKQNGATIRQAGGFHVGFAVSHFHYFAEAAATYRFEEPQPTIVYPTLSTNTIRKEPIGVCAGVVAWNFPLLLAVWKLGPALAAGNSFVLKPDEKTPLTALEFARIAAECGLPDGVLNVVTGVGEEVGAALAAHPDVDKIAFTGSTAVGREVMRLAATNVKRVTLELGGKSPVVVLDDADIETAIDAALFGGMLYCGQACESGSRLLLPASLHDEFVERMVARARQIKIGDPMDYDTDFGPIVSARQRDRILEYIRVGVEEGATLALGGGVPEGERFERGFWVEPTIFTDVRRDMRIAQEEIFGPVLSVLKYEDEDEAVSIANDSIYGLAAAIWTTDNERGFDLAKRIRAGTVWINDAHMVNCAMPFGGYKQSGVGRELGPNALDEYVEVKNVHLDLSGRLDRRVYDVLLSEPPA
ncbi:MAG: aldehyde dehydrogenase [Solirubrobacterales bacterium]